jgi:hypothetical protein
MYDILYAKKENDTTHYIVIHDPKETNLFAKLDEYIKKYNDWDTQNNPLSKSKKEIKKYKKDYLTNVIIFDYFSYPIESIKYIYNDKKIFKGSLFKIYPPPKA